MNSITVKIEVGDATIAEADVLVLKHARRTYGLDSLVAGYLDSAGVSLRFPDIWESWKVNSVPPLTKTSNILFIGVPRLGEFRYPEIRKFASMALATLASELPHARKVLFTVHGIGYGLDEAEAFGAEIAGFSDAVQAMQIPGALHEITIIENNHRRAKRLEEYLRKLLPDGRISWADPSSPQAGSGTTEKLQGLGQETDAKAHVFVAMPFEEEMDDVYHYGIYSAVNAAGFICERSDFSSFTGDIMHWVKSRIRTASLVIADLTNANPNVYLEIGYAWGVGIPTVLVSRDGEHLEFDVIGQRCLIYKKIRQLQDLLTSELSALRLRM